MKRTIQHILLESSRLEYDAFHRTTPIPVNSHVHNHLCFEFYLFISGAERFFVNDHILTLQENDLLIFPPFQIHGMPGSKEGIYERMVIYLHPELINKLSMGALPFVNFFSQACSSGLRKFNMAPEDVKACQALVQRIYSRREEETPEQLMADYADLLQFLLIAYHTVQADDSSFLPASSYSLINSALEYIHQHYRENVTRTSLADADGVSKSHLSHEFKRQTGYGIYEYILIRRVLRSCEWLVTDMPLSEIACDMGFSDYSSYLKAFRKIMKCAPSEYRKAHRNPFDAKS